MYSYLYKNLDPPLKQHTKHTGRVVLSAQIRTAKLHAISVAVNRNRSIEFI